MCSNYRIAIFVAIFCSTIAAVPAPFQNQELQLRLMEHRNRVNGFKCGNPQLRSYKISKLLPLGQINTNEILLPLNTVIRTCDEGTGCCDSEEKSCAPAAVDGFEEEEVIVKVTDIIGLKNSTLRKLKIQHHKKCECRLRTDYVASPPQITLVDETET